MRAAAQEELEAQKLYTEAARLKAESNEALSQLRQQMGSLLASPNGGAQGRPAPAQPQSASPQRPVALPAAAAAPAPRDRNLNQPAVPQPKDQSSQTAAAAPQTKPPEENPPLSRKKVGRWFGLGG